VVAKATQLNKRQQISLLRLLQKYEALFDGTLGKWNTDPVNIELREDAKPVSSRYYPVPKINKETFRKELLRLVDIGVLTPVQDSEWGTHVFIIPKKDGTVRFITDYRKVNKLIKRKPYPLPRIANMLQELEGFQFASALDLNMGYYTIRLTPGAKDLTTIVTEFGKFRYNVLPMGMCCSGDVFQAKVDQLLGDIDGVKTYINDILVISKGSFDDHLKQLDTCFKRIQDAGLKVKAVKCSFGLSEIPYLGYIISREGIKPDPAKIQGIMDMNRPRTTTEARAIIGSVQY
jgi:Reverse transcriptase (RNA-dependent DNA polymerase).